MAGTNPTPKPAILAAIRVALEKEFETFQQASRQTRQLGNDGECKADSKYDTQSTEANYLADGQARQAEKLAQAAAAFEAMEPREFNKFDFIEVGALVELEINKQAQWFFLGLACGGLEINVDRREITVITPDSPIGEQLINRRTGDYISSPGALIISVS